ncbi:MAG: LptF/LptG family permease, partial [Bacteroidia bacterium]|nr:LptF/LptG family permease [Bacteroidia bacterium]MDW8134300.1 LptF/LptG family permease [Bacteroidia bacterium]
MGIKRLDRYILVSFTGPFLASFSTTLVILVIQFLSRYQEDILGKGFPTAVLVELFLYACASLVLLALPMGLLMAGLITMGNLGERLELTALQSGGVSFVRTLRPILFVGLLCFIMTSVLSWYWVPKANLKLYTLLYDMEQARPALALKPGLFNRWIDGYAIRIGKLEGEKRVKDILIYEYAPEGNIDKTITADSGEIFIDAKWLFLVFTLYHGCQYETSIKPKQPPAWIQACFDTLILRLDMSGLGLKRSDERIFAGHQYMLSIGALRGAIDSLVELTQSAQKEFMNVLQSVLPSPRAYTLTLSEPPLSEALHMQTDNLIRRERSLAEYHAQRLRHLNETVWRYELEWYYKFAYPLASVVFLVLGVSLGSVIRKGGLGMPLVVSTAFFLVFYILNAQGK